jgi:hypothetical protein
VSGLNESDKAFKFAIQNFLLGLPYKLKTYYFEKLPGDMGSNLILMRSVGLKLCVVKSIWLLLTFHLSKL